MDICIKTIPHTEQNYDTVGDYWTNEDGLVEFRISKIGDDYEFLVLIHELIEQYLTKRRGITEKSICEFDVQYEEERKKGLHPKDAEPGDDLKAPYRKEHKFATLLERLLAHELGVDWEEYEDIVMSLEY